MMLATIDNGTRDGDLVIVSRDHRLMASASPIIPNLQTAMERWHAVEPELRAMSDDLNAQSVTGAQDFNAWRALAPLPRSWQWLDGSAYESHGALMQKVFGLDPVPRDRPLMYQGLSDLFRSWREDVRLPDERDGIDFEGEFGIIVDAVPMGTPAEKAAAHIRLIVQINDWSLRAIAPVEMKTGFGWVQAKPACSMAPVAVTPDELGPAWRDGRVALPLIVEWNGERFGAANGDQMSFSFPELVAHAARTRDLVAGTIIGSGTVSNENYREVGSSCIAERRGIELLDDGVAKTPFMRFGDRVRMEAKLPDGSPLFGAIDQIVARAMPPTS